ncbi:MAG: hypothetical protein AB9844_09345 [Clostridiaceae bacterium]
MSIIKKQDKEDRELLLTRELTEKNQVYIEKLKEVEKFKEQALKKRENAKMKVKDLNKQMQDLYDKFLLEIDDKKLREIEKKRKDLMDDININKSIAETDYTILFKRKIDELEAYKGAADEERKKFNEAVINRAAEYRQLIAVCNKSIVALNVIKRDHPSVKASHLVDDILRVDGLSYEKYEKRIKHDSKNEEDATDPNVTKMQEKTKITFLT